MHLLDEVRSHVGQLEVAPLTLLVWRGDHFDWVQERDLHFETMQVDCTYFGLLVELCSIQVLKLPYCLMVETLNHAILLQVVLLNQLVQCCHSLLISISALDGRYAGHLELNVHQVAQRTLLLASH